MRSRITPRYFGFGSYGRVEVPASTFSFLLALLLLRWNKVLTVFVVFILRYHFLKYVWRFVVSVLKVDSIVFVLFDWWAIAKSSAYPNFRELVSGISLMYMLKRVGASTEPCGTPFLIFLFLLVLLPRHTW